MGWRDQLQRASFRGEAFGIVAHARQGGRRVQVTEFAFRDQPDTHDLGAAPQQLSLEAFVLGDNYMAARDKLLAALEKAGPGKLVHPYLGEMQAQLISYTLNENTQAGGKADFQLTFIRAEAQAGLVASTDTAAKVAENAQALEARADQALNRFWRKPQRITELAVMASALDGYAAQLDQVRSFALPAQDALASVAEVRRALGSLAGNTQTLAGQPALLVGSLREILDGTAALLLGQPKRLSAAAAQLANSLPRLPGSGDTVSRAVNALADQADSAALSWSAQAISATGYATRNEAEQAKQAWLALADSLMATAPDALYDQILDLRSAVLQDVAERVVNLPALRSYTPGATLPALVLAHQLYGDATRSQELLERNAIRHPGFVAGGQALEVLDV